MHKRGLRTTASCCKGSTGSPIGTGIRRNSQATARSAGTRLLRSKPPAIRHGRFDLIWLPPPSFAGAHSAGYNPKEYFNLSNSYGDLAQHLSMLASLLGNGVEPIADVVINHRDGSHRWADFKNPDWGTWAITRNDEAFTNPNSDVYGTPENERGAAEEQPVEYAQHGGTTYGYGSFRDIDHTSERVRRDLIRHLLQLKSAGYRGWRYDMVHGYHAKWIAVYNRASAPTFSVGEYDWDKPDEQRGWIWHTATVPGRLDTASSVFDFMTMFHLKDNKSNYAARYESGRRDRSATPPMDIRGRTGPSRSWRTTIPVTAPTRTGRRSRGMKSDSFANGWEVEQGYAHILTHPGVPTVYWKHYFDWGVRPQGQDPCGDQCQEGGGRPRRKYRASAGQRPHGRGLCGADRRAQWRPLRSDRRR